MSNPEETKGADDYPPMPNDLGKERRDYEAIAAAFPFPLAKACLDPFAYVLGLRGGMVLEFEFAWPSADLEWVQLHGVSIVAGADYKPCLERGLYVRVSEIAWVADAPHGS